MKVSKMTEDNRSYTPPETKSYDEMIKLAAAISPLAKLRTTYENTWEIYIPTEFEVVWELPEKYKNTPAWTFNEEHYAGESGLARWGRKNGQSSLCLEGLADIWNENERFQTLAIAERKRLNDKDGIDMGDFTDINREDIAAYKKNDSIASDKFMEEHRERLEAIYDKWSI
jgi:hypothetical protein